LKVVLQRVLKASVWVNDSLVSKIEKGILLFLGIGKTDHLQEKEKIEYLCQKILNLRIFEDKQGKMNKSILNTSGEILLISQFTLYANSKKGNRPSYTDAAPSEQANRIYDAFGERLEQNIRLKKGIFGENMKIKLINDGPVTIILKK